MPFSSDVGFTYFYYWQNQPIQNSEEQNFLLTKIVSISKNNVSQYVQLS